MRRLGTAIAVVALLGALGCARGGPEKMSEEQLAEVQRRVEPVVQQIDPEPFVHFGYHAPTFSTLVLEVAAESPSPDCAQTADQLLRAVVEELADLPENPQLNLKVKLDGRECHRTDRTLTLDDAAKDLGITRR